jgi:hypothetical protein
VEARKKELERKKIEREKEPESLQNFQKKIF